MEEKQIISGKQQLSVIPIIVAIIGIVLLVLTFSGNSILSYDTYHGRKPYLWAVAAGAILLIIGIIFAIGTSCCQLFVTNKRVYGKAVFGKRVDIPIDSVSAVGTIPLLNGISICSSSGAIKFLYISNSNEIHSEVSKLIIARQDNKSSSSVQAPAKIEMAQSNADELKKYKELFDSGVITEEEFAEKKKQLLGL